jgi:hypothetical protein
MAFKGKNFMLISNQYNFIFVHIPKTAGQSVTKALAPFATGRWQGKVNNLLSSKITISRSFLNRWHIYHPHITAEELIDILGEKKFSSYFSFAIVRNPWEWQVSLYNYSLKNPKHKSHQLMKSLGSFEEYVTFLFNRKNSFLQKPFVFDNKGKQLVKYIGRYETLQEDFNLICSRLGISVQLPKLNIYQTKDYKKYYNQEKFELIHQKFLPDIETFGYTFG